MSASGSAGPGFDPRRGSKFSFENFQPRGKEGWRCTLSNRYIVRHRPGLNSKPFLSPMLRRQLVLLIAIRPSDGDVKPNGPLGALREEQAMRRHRVSPSSFLSSSSHTPQHNYTTQTATHTVTLTSTFYSALYRYSSHT